MKILSAPTSKAFALFVLTFICSISVHAATITWGTTTTINADTDVSTAGTFVSAFDLQNTSGALTINSVTFATTGLGTGNVGTFGSGEGSLTIAAGANGNSGFGSGSAPFVNLSSNYKSLLSGDAFAVATMTFNNLSIGTTYAVQVWVNDSTAHSGEDRGTTFTAGNAVSLDVNTSVGSVAGGVGQTVIGTFTADASTQSITLAGIVNVSYLAATQLRNVSAIPEPSTYAAIFGVVTLGCAALLRRRKKSV